MYELNCENCGAALDLFEAEGGVAICKFCGSKFVLPKDEQKEEVLFLLRSGKAALQCCDFERAYTLYSQAAEADPAEPEAYFGMALAECRVQYLKDTVNNRLQPICHEIAEGKFSDGKNYKKALSLATSEQREEYERKAAEIDYIRKDFFKLKKTGLDYDCFICVKIKDGNGKYTQDNFIANRLYHKLKSEGYHPFYSEEEIGNRSGADYEALILYALYSSKCMLLVCSNKEHLKTPWVKNEYTRFLTMIADDAKERDSITFIYRNSPVEKLLGVRGKVQGIDFNDYEAIDKIRDFVDRHDPAKQREQAERERQQELAVAEAKERKEQEREEKRLAAEKKAEEAARAAQAAAKELEEIKRRFEALQQISNLQPQKSEEELQFDRYLQAAEQGDAEAQYHLGFCFYNGQCVEQDYVKAVEWFGKAAEQGVAKAQCDLGICYCNGQGVKQDYTKAAELFGKAAEQGYITAQYNLGICYYNGQGVEQDYEKAVRWYRKVAKRGYVIAQYILGVCYYNGQGIKQNYEKAAEWFGKAAEQGYVTAKNNLGDCFYHGQGVKQDYIKAAEWYRNAAEQGYAIAQNNLGICYYNGQGVEQDLEKAAEWARKSFDNGCKEAEDLLNDCKQRIENKG